MKRTIKEIAERMTSSAQYTVFVVGDSITEGTGSTDAEHTYTAYFARELVKHFEDRCVVRYDGQRYPDSNAELLPLMTYGEPIDVGHGDGGMLTVVRCGIGGNTVRRLLKRRDDFIGKKIDGRTADLFVVMVGINDALSADPAKYVSADLFAEQLNELIGALADCHPNADLILMTPTYNDSGKAKISHLAPYADAMRRLCCVNGIPLVDQHRLWMKHLVVGASNYGQGDWLCGAEGDSCHPSNLGHQKIAQALFDALFLSDNG